MADQPDDRFDSSTADRTMLFSGNSGEQNFFRPGETIDRTYRLIKEIGRGAMGVVFSCTHIVLNKDYALKLLLDEQLNDEAWKRFQIEAQALAKLKHPGIVGIHNMGIHHGLDHDTPYYVMDLLSGENLADLIESSGHIPVEQAINYFSQVADALYSAHLQGVVHRDIKPSNIMLVRDQNRQISQIKIVDFGIARLNKSGHGNQSQTATGAIFGTPFYMSPEQCRGERVDERSDIYSFGCALYEALTGSPPFQGGNSFQTFMMHQTDEAPTLESKGNGLEFSEGLESLVEKCLRKEVGRRYQNMQQVKHDFERVKQGKEVAKKGLRSTISPDQPLFESRRLQIEAGEEEDDEDYEEEEAQGIMKRPILALAIALFFSLSTIAVLAVVFWPAETRPVKPIAAEKDTLAEALNDRLVPTDQMARIGASPAEVRFFKTFDWENEKENESNYKKKILQVLSKAGEKGAQSPVYVVNGVMHFPTDMYWGAVQVGSGPIIYATGNIPISSPEAPGKLLDVHYYQPCIAEKMPAILSYFKPNDLTGIDLKTEYPLKALAVFKTWTRLKDLSFFNSIFKAFPDYEHKFEDSHISDELLPEINKFTQLRSLGLCGDDITGGAVARMPLMRTLTSLKLKRIRKVDNLLDAVPAFDNIEELWLMSMNLTDKQLEPLTRMKNLKSLRITRSALTPGAIDYFRRMPALKKLKIDRNWSEADRQKLKDAVPGAEFETVFDTHFWRLYPNSTYPPAIPR